jgi:plasmid stability protein
MSKSNWRRRVAGASIELTCCHWPEVVINQYAAQVVDIIYCYMISLRSIAHEVLMSSITIRNIPEETHRALRVRAAMAGRSTEAEVRAILESAARPDDRIKLGSLLAEIGQQAGGADLVIERDKTPTEPLSFE